MKFKSFRQLLLKKTDTSPALQTLIKYANDEFFADQVIESLEKMARSSNTGKRANNAVRWFGQSMDSTPDAEGETPGMIRNAIGHHVSHYKAALKGAGEAKTDHEKRQFNDTANSHAAQAFKVLHMADKVEKHAPVMANGKRMLEVDYVSPHAWERTIPGRMDKDPVSSKHTMKNDTKGLGYWKHSNKYGFDHLQNAPHESVHQSPGFSEVKDHGHNGAYPFEHIAINGKYIHVDDETDPSGSHTHHTLDHHPILNHFMESPTKRNEESDKKYLGEVDAFHGSPHIDHYYDNEEKTEQADPEKYKSRGSQVSSPVHAETDRLQAPEKSGGSKPSSKAEAKPVAEKEQTKSHADIVSELQTRFPDVWKRLQEKEKRNGQ